MSIFIKDVWPKLNDREGIMMAENGIFGSGVTQVWEVLLQRLTRGRRMCLQIISEDLRRNCVLDYMWALRSRG